MRQKKFKIIGNFSLNCVHLAAHNGQNFEFDVKSMKNL